MKKKSMAYVIGRFSPPHKGHILFLLWLLSKFDRVIIGIGSCYEVGTFRHPLLAFLREKMIRRSLIVGGVNMNRVSFVHLQDFKNDWLGWWKHIMSIFESESITHFVTGNTEDILAVIKEKNIPISFEMINPETDMPKELAFPYHATDLRNVIIKGDYDLFRKIAATGTIELMGRAGGFAGIREALNNNGTNFIPGRQAVDLIVTCKKFIADNKSYQHYVLTGYRSIDKPKDRFPGCLAIPGGAIKDYENPMRAVIREGYEETGINIKIVDDSLEPAHVVVYGKTKPIIGELKFVKIFSTNDLNFKGSNDGSSQVFCIHLDCEPEEFNDAIKSESDLKKVAFRSLQDVLIEGLAFQQDDMLKQAMKLI